MLTYRTNERILIVTIVIESRIILAQTVYTATAKGE